METNKTEVVNKTEAPNSFSFRWGGTGDEVKLYFENSEDLIKKIEAVILGIGLVNDFKNKQNEVQE
tara:strand:- start:776 stop:973 length:198 start_codon:yes stop_codon:yes gene_type:complete